MILLIDNYDSFTYNLAQYLGELGAAVDVRRNDVITLDEIAEMAPSHIVVSPGPGTPDQAGISLSLIERFAASIPILGVCLGHQAIGQAFGGQVVRAERLMHGKVSSVHHDGRGIFSHIPSPLVATRYHSLIVPEPLPDCLEVTARAPEGEVMGLRHREYPVFGVQFHPESVLTRFGSQLLRNFLELFRQDAASEPAVGEAEATMSIRGAIAKAMEGQDLTESEAEAAMTQIMEGEATQAQIGAFLTALRMKGEAVSEITGSARAMRNSAIPVRPKSTNRLVDTCGTGGDMSGTFNVSTTAAFVVAGAGQPVAKHGNRSISSKSGSADVLEALGVNLELTPDQVADCIDEVGIGFLFAPKLHPAMKHAVGPRRELGVRTIFNVLGPLTNPAGAAAQVIGVYDAELTEPIAKVLNALGSEAAFVVHGAGRIDELTTIGSNRVSELRAGHVRTYALDPFELGFTRAYSADLRGGDAGENAEITRQVLSGADQGARRDAVVLNAAAALAAGGKAAGLREGIRLAAESIDSGAAQAVMDRLATFTQEMAA
jgi:anthranilate synthase/phosphoribosyltransferase